MLVRMSVFGVQIYPAKNGPMVILAKMSNNPTLNSNNQDRKNALAIYTSITEILTIAFLINPDNKNSALVKEFTGSFHEFVGKDITQIEIKSEADYVGLIHSTRDEKKQTLKIRASDAISLSMILKMPIYTKRKYLKNLDEIYGCRSNVLAFR